MQRLVLIVGILLSGLAVAGYAVSGFTAPTALIPMLVGIPLTILGAVALTKESQAVVGNRIALVLAILGFLASASRIPALSASGLNQAVSVLGMLVLCLVVMVAGFGPMIVRKKAG